ncbi:MAG: hypothetical protein FWF75_07105, partial [Propionibacteriaceae bacterium]|nr:hypothetical protein [Propionibacteriaceae bacterium]
MTQPLPPAPSISDLVDALDASYRAEPSLVKIDDCDQISRAEVIAATERLRSIVFGGFFTDKPLAWDSVGYFLGGL